MMRYLLVGACAAVLGGGVAWAQMPPPGEGPMGPEGRPDGRMEMHGMHRPPRFMPHGTAFRFKKGDTEVDVACSDRDSVQSCVSGATTLLDKLMNAPAPAKP